MDHATIYDGEAQALVFPFARRAIFFPLAGDASPQNLVLP
jgi:hypothetical protein